VFASIMALVLQKVGQTQGLVNPILYGLAYNQTYSGGAAVFHDIVKGTNTVPGVTGYSAGPGYDMATGLGSVDATQLVNHWLEGKYPSEFPDGGRGDFRLCGSRRQHNRDLHCKDKQWIQFGRQLSVTGLPAGVTGSFAPTSLTGSGSTTLTLAATSSATRRHLCVDHQRDTPAAPHTAPRLVSL
jgi:hypothetical protein